MKLSVNRTTARPLYTQIAEQIKTEISTGRLPDGTKLPTVRWLAEDLGITRMTVQSAYQLLQSEGWIESQVGRGTFVKPARLPLTIPPSAGISMRPGDMLLEMGEIRVSGQFRSMISAEPDPALFPHTEYSAAVQAAASVGDAIYRYAPIQGDNELRVLLARRFANENIHVTPDDLLITNSAVHALSLVAASLAERGDTVLVESPSFLGFNHTLQTFGLRTVEIPFDNDGPSLQHLEEAAIKHKPKFFFTIPDFHNPTGVCTTLERRRAILALMQKLRVPIIEDGVYTKLAYDAPVPPSYRALDTGESVIYVNSFSKWLMPGVRVGLVIASTALMQRLALQKHATEGTGPLLLQRALAHFLLDGGGERHLQRTLPIYRRRRDAALQALRRHMPHSVRWSEPSGGFAIWLTLPYSAEPATIYRTALHQRLALFPGDPFFNKPPKQTVHFRLCFGRQTETAIDSCIAQLADIIRTSS